MMEIKKLGLSFQHCLNRMYESVDRAWYPGCGWKFATRDQTIRIMENLHKAGLVDKSANEKYTLKSETVASIAAWRQRRISIDTPKFKATL